jgi:glycosyltransferase involved in cell wall biosynthesis
MPAIVARRPARLTVVGDGPQRRILEAKARDLPVDFAGYLSAPADVAAFLRSIDVFVMPSRWEGLPNALLEALECGANVVATDVPGMAEAAAGSAILVPPDEPALLADAVCRSLDTPKRRTASVDSFDEVAANHLVVFERAYRRRAARTAEPRFRPRSVETPTRRWLGRG